ncbi:MAG TPA: DUF5715 family protein [Acidobacteriaceae bacterium]|nr:DUF5715 family protein [Acidobacteriaceae bacterium]
MRAQASHPARTAHHRKTHYQTTHSKTARHHASATRAHITRTHTARAHRYHHPIKVTTAAVAHRRYAAHLERTSLTHSRRYISRRSVHSAPSYSQVAQADEAALTDTAPATEHPVAEEEGAADPALPVTTATAHGQQLMVPIPRFMPAPLRGSHDVLVHQNIIADVEGLSRIQNEAQIQEMLHEKLLVALPVGAMLDVDPRLPVNRRYCRPWTADFLSNIAREHMALFQNPLQVTSAVRTVQFQEHLERINGNAAPAMGDTASPHLTGATIDIAKKGMSMHEIAWMRAYLGQLQQEGKLDVEEEFQQACFHISVYETYEPSMYPNFVAPSRTLEVRADAPRSVRMQSATLHTTRRASTRRRRRHVSVSMLAVRMR